MWQADVATTPCQEARENDGLLYGSAGAVGHDEEAAEECWYHDEKADIKQSFNGGCCESFKAQREAQRRTHPGYPRPETRSFGRLDWRGLTIVSSTPQ